MYDNWQLQRRFLLSTPPFNINETTNEDGWNPQFFLNNKNKTKTPKTKVDAEPRTIQPVSLLVLHCNI
jgi:hypothetical protein